MDELLKAILALSYTDRVELVEVILASLQPEKPAPFDESWRPAITRRSRELESGRVVGISWSEAKRRSHLKAEENRQAW
jgi:putative addiction module component (TIGR02574 family)